MDDGDTSVAGAVALLGSSVGGAEADSIALGNDLADGAAVAASLDAASLALDPIDFVSSADSLMSALGSDLDAANRSISDVDFTPFDPGSGPDWKGGTVPTAPAPTSAGSDSGLPKIFIPLSITQNAPAFAGLVSTTLGNILGVLAPVATAFLLFNALFNESYNQAEWDATVQQWIKTDPIGFAIWDVEQRISNLQPQLAVGALSQVGYLAKQMAKLQAELDALNQMKYT
jgi:hypothetical protein